MEKKIQKTVIGVYFMGVAIMMYYFQNEYIDVGLQITFRHAFALILFGSAVLLFLYRPNIARGVTVFKDACIYSLPLVVIITVSMFIWFVGMADTAVISRGLSSSLVYTNMLSMALGAGALLYIFGEKAVWYNLVAILTANLVIIATVIAQNGIGTYVSEFITLIVTFADVTGEVIVQAEIHELAFCLGAYLVYMLYKPKKSILFLILLVLNLFCFLSAFKRIAIIALVIALAFGYLLKFIARFSQKTAFGLLLFFSFCLVILLLAYVGIIKMGAFELLEEAGINTSGRVGVYHAVDEFYQFDPAFLGNGIGFLTYQLNTFMYMGVASVHNDFLQHFIDLGFWGYIIWLVTMIFARVLYFGKKGNLDNAIITFILMVYLIVVSATDNTMNYPLLTCVLAMLMMGNSFAENVRTCEYKIFGYVSPENAEESRSLL
ncbi:MAG: O-antigen ligase family protein [Clostridia bacterium]|nr:O-antigen ligase family protein [Clostridia bacterium]